jgi:hypothetical protein
MNNDMNLLCFRVSRRAIGLAVFSGVTLECTFVRELTSEARSAGQSARAFARWALETFPTDAILIEQPVTQLGSRARELDRILRDELAVIGKPLAELSSRDVLAPRDQPSRSPRQELRLMARMLWPALLRRPCNPVALDAAVLGLYRQTVDLLGSKS